MNIRSQKWEIGNRPCPSLWWVSVLAVSFLLMATMAEAEGFHALCADRAAIERVYYNHRLGQKPPFEEASPPALIERLVRQDRREEAALRRVYGVEITPAMLDAEVQRINTTTRAPEMLAEIKTALGNDPVRFANAFAKPFLVERLLRERFENDDKLHAYRRQACEAVRNRLLAAHADGATIDQLLAQLRQTDANAVTETTWQLGARPAADGTPSADEMEIKKRFGPDAQLLSSPQANGNDHKPYFEDLPPALQNVLRVQLRAPGNISAVIETPSGFLLYLVREKTEEVLAVACLSLPKQSYEEWLNQQMDPPH